MSSTPNPSPPVSHSVGPSPTVQAPTPVATEAVLRKPRPGVFRLLVAANIISSVWYFSWLLSPERVGNPWLYGLLLAAEMFNVAQALGFWWTLYHDRRALAEPAPLPHYAAVDVYVPRYNEPVEIVEPVIAAAVKLRGADVTVYLLDDGDDPDMAAMAARHGAKYLTREQHTGAKAGNINAALARTDGDYVLVLDCDHVPHPEFLRRTLGHFTTAKVAFVQTPQYYANADRNPIAAASWAQQALFFGAISRGKNALGSMFCCGTNVVFRRTALDDIGGFPEQSVTEDFELSVMMQERGWATAYVPEVLVQGLGPLDMASYVSQQQRWARGCLSAAGRVARAALPVKVKAQYLLSSLYFLTGWTVLIYMTLPIVRILTGEQPVAAAGADTFLLHFLPYFVLAIVTVAVGGGGTYTFAAFCLASASFWIHIVASLQVLLRRRGSFVVTPKNGAGQWQPGTVWPGLVMCAALLGSSAWGLSQTRDAAMLNNVAFALVHVCVLGTGLSLALRPAWLERRANRDLPRGEARWQSPDGQPVEDQPESLRALTPAA